MANHPVRRAFLPLALALLAVAGCDQQGTGNSFGDPPPMLADRNSTPSVVGGDGTLVTDAADAAGSLTVMSVGGPEPFVADSNRRAVYVLEGDRDGSGCVGGCLAQWAPVFPPTAEPTVEGGLAPVLLGSLERPDGSRQLSYNGHPLYHHAADARPGQVHGHGVADEWGRWSLLTPKGDPVGRPVGDIDQHTPRVDRAPAPGSEAPPPESAAGSGGDPEVRR